MSQILEANGGISKENDEFSIIGWSTPTEAIQHAIEVIKDKEIGNAASTWKLRDANFSRQRYWESHSNLLQRGIACTVDEADLPLELPDTEDFTPKGGEGPLSRLEDWTYKGFPLETDTMPGYAGSSWYFLRFMDPTNTDSFLSRDKADYWQDVDFYVGGTEHAVGHLLYARFWHKFLFDIGLVSTEEPFKRLFNQGMIKGKHVLSIEMHRKQTPTIARTIHR